MWGHTGRRGQPARDSTERQGESWRHGEGSHSQEWAFATINVGLKELKASESGLFETGKELVKSW